MCDFPARDCGVRAVAKGHSAKALASSAPSNRRASVRIDLAAALAGGRGVVCFLHPPPVGARVVGKGVRSSRLKGESFQGMAVGRRGELFCAPRSQSPMRTKLSRAVSFRTREPKKMLSPRWLFIFGAVLVKWHRVICP